MEVGMAVLEEARLKGCYSIKYQDPTDSEWQLSVDFNWHTEQDMGKTLWTCTESPIGTIHWTSLRTMPCHAVQALLDHFGLAREDFGVMLLTIFDLSPAILARMRRKKEEREGLGRKEIKNMRMGCPPKELFADDFE